MRNSLLPHRFVRARPHLSLAIVFGLVVGYVLPASDGAVLRILIGWNAGVWSYLPVMAWLMMRADHHTVRRVAALQDENAGVVLATLVIASALSLATIVFELGGDASLSDSTPAVRFGLTALTIFGAWFLVGTLFCFHYAHLYYTDGQPRAPLEFPGDGGQPNYWDFLYFSFTIAVAVQTSDVVILTRGMRKLALAQSVLTFFFNLVILGLSVNIAAGLINK
ncbi:MAG: DUF1345 domain-containing protein [Pseudomonadota bacterium]